MEDPSSAAESAGAAHEKPWKSRWRAFLRHPASILVWFCLISLTIKEEYPFSNFPMYSGWGDRTHYFYIRNADGPIEAKKVFKVSVPRTKKLYGGLIDDIEEARDIGYNELTEADFTEAGRLLLKQLRDEAPAKRRKKHGAIMDAPLTLVRVEIVLEDGEFTKTESDVITSAADNKPITAPAPAAATAQP